MPPRRGSRRSRRSASAGSRRHRIRRRTSGSSRRDWIVSRLVNRRIRLFLAALVVAFGVLLLRAAWLQGVRAETLSSLARTQHREEVTLPAGRGTVYDRTGVQLALGEQATTVYANPH